MGQLFAGCSSLKSLDVSNFNTPNVSNIDSLFYNCSGLTSLDVSSFNTENVYGMEYTFSGCSGLTRLDLSSFNTGGVYTMEGMFRGNPALVTIVVSDGWNTDNVKYSADMFEGCTSLVGGDGTTCDPNYTDKTKAYAGPGGYLTMEGQETNSDDLQDYLNSLEDTEDTMAGSTYRREFRNTDWQSLYLPFDVNYDDWAEGFEVARFDGIDIIEGQPVLAASIMDSGKMRANTPYLIRAKNEGSSVLSVNYNETNYSVRSVSYSTDGATYTFTGNYTNKADMFSDQRYRMLGGWLNIPTSDSEVLPPYRWYMTIDDSVPSFDSRSLKLCIVAREENALGIDESTVSESDNFPAVRTVVYDIQGRKIENARNKKGIYIINNRKYIII